VKQKAEKTQKLSAIMGPMRVPFLILSPACVFLGLGTALWSGSPFNLLHLSLALIGALTAHISVNALNEYFDFKSGLDLHTTRTPFSGGSGTLPALPSQAHTALLTGLVSALTTVAVGIFFLIVRGIGILPIGLLGLVVIFTYTSFLNRQPIVCLIAPGLGFGSLMVIGTHYALSGTYSFTAILASFIPFFLVSNLLLLNQFPDVDADRDVGRRHLPIVYGRKTSSIVYGLFLLLAYLIIILAVISRVFPLSALLGLIPLVVAIPLAIGVYKNASAEIPKLIPFMGMNVIINILTPVLTAIGFLIG